MFWVHSVFPCIAYMCVVWTGPPVNLPSPTQGKGVFAHSMREVLKPLPCVGYQKGPGGHG